MKVPTVTETQKRVNLFKNILVDDVLPGIIMLDTKGYVIYTNKRHAEYLQIPQDEVLHTHISDITRPNVSDDFIEVLQTGKAKLGNIIQAHNREYIADQVPLMHQDRIIGAVGIIHFDINDLDVLTKKMKVVENQLKYYREQLRSLRSSRYSFADILGQSDVIQSAKREAQRAARIGANVLLIGETGTGKELFAHAIHNESPRKSGPFIRVNSAAIPRELLESELFGYESGSFTGGRKDGKKGKFELADKGSIFLDEIGDMPLSMQSALLRVLQEKEVERIGGSKSISVDFRLIAATNKNLEEMIEQASFRKDLFYRLNVVRIELPPLRTWLEDIPILTKVFLKQKSLELGLKKITCSPEAIVVLQQYDYPGNIRELKNILEKSISHTEIEAFLGQSLTISHYDISLALGDDSLTRADNVPKKRSSLRSLQNDHESTIVKEALSTANGNLSKCAEILGIHRTGVYRKIKRYDLHAFLATVRNKAKE